MVILVLLCMLCIFVYVVYWFLTIDKNAKNTINKLSAKIEVLNVSPDRAYKTLKFINTSTLTYKRALAKILKEAEKINADVKWE